MLSFTLDPAVLGFGILLVLVLLSARPSPPAASVVVVQAPEAEPAGGFLFGLFVFGLLVLFVVQFLGG